MRPAVRIILASRKWLRFLIPGTLLVAIVAAGALAWAEAGSVRSYWDGLWWSLSLVTTVGFVGPVPETATGKVVSSILMVLGFALMAMTTAAVASLFVREDEIPDEERQVAFERAVLGELAAMRRELEELRELHTERPAGESASGSQTDAG